jgi:hypothetical protein
VDLNWFTAEQLKDAFPNSARLQARDEVEIDNYIIPAAVGFVYSATGLTSEEDPIVGQIAMRVARNMVLGDDENILIARARGQTGLTIAGTSISLDLGKNVWLDAADEELLSEYEAARKGRVHTDKVVVDAMGSRYLQDDRGGRGSKSADYVRDDRVPGYFAGMPGKPRG